MNNIWRGKRALYILFSLIVEDLSCLCACSCYISAQCGQFGRWALTRLIPMALLIIISASQVFIMTLIIYLVIVTKVHSNTDVYLYLKWATNVSLLLCQSQPDKSNIKRDIITTVLRPINMTNNV